MKRPIVILTDFGESHYLGIMKGVILRENPDAKIIDLYNHIGNFDIQSALFILKTSYKYFPDNSIYLAVVDPGVGSSRRGIIVKNKERFFVGPDNGIFTPFFEGGDVYEIDIPPDVSYTFHGRDIFAPVAAQLSLGINPETLGEKISDPVKLSLPATRIEGDIIKGEVIFIDNFGNLITNIEASEIPFVNFVVELSGTKSIKHFRYYSEVSRGEILAITGSSGYIEISVREGSAAQILKARLGDKVIVRRV